MTYNDISKLEEITVSLFIFIIHVQTALSFFNKFSHLYMMIVEFMYIENFFCLKSIHYITCDTCNKSCNFCLVNIEYSVK